MSAEIIVASDTHGRDDLLTELERAYPRADLYLYCGDLESSPSRYPRWTFVRGNNDYYADSAQMPDMRVISIAGHRILMCHSHTFGYYRSRMKAMVEAAKRNRCDILLYGHNHVGDLHKEDGVLVLNPGSLRLPRDGMSPSYARIVIDDDGEVHAHIYHEEEWPFQDPEAGKHHPGWFW